MAWVSPTGHNDPDTEWADEVNAYDDDTVTYAQDSIPTNSWGAFLELTISAITCDKLRFWAYYGATTINQIDLDAYYNSTWNNVYEGSFADRTWVEKSLGASYSVTKARCRFYNDDNLTAQLARFYEFDFFQVVGVGVPPIAAYYYRGRS